MTALWSGSIVSLAQRAMAATMADPAGVLSRSIDKFVERREWRRPRCHCPGHPALVCEAEPLRPGPRRGLTAMRQTSTPPPSTMKVCPVAKPWHIRNR
jgi:hypothetical protein